MTRFVVRIHAGEQVLAFDLVSKSQNFPQPWFELRTSIWQAVRKFLSEIWYVIHAGEQNKKTLNQIIFNLI